MSFFFHFDSGLDIDMGIFRGQNVGCGAVHKFSLQNLLKSPNNIAAMFC